MINNEKIISLLSEEYPDVIFIDGYTERQRRRIENKIICALYTEMTEDKFDGYEREKLSFNFLVSADNKNRAVEIFGGISEIFEELFCFEAEIEAVIREKAYTSGENIVLPCSVVLKRAKTTKLNCTAFRGDTI